MYLLLFLSMCRLQPGGKKAFKNKICFRVKLSYPESELELKTKNNICKTIKVFKTLSEALLKDKIKQVKCLENKKMKCKECYCL